MGGGADFGRVKLFSVIIVIGVGNKLLVLITNFWPLLQGGGWFDFWVPEGGGYESNEMIVRMKVLLNE